MYTPLSKSYKGVFPFKIGTTSYIYPDHILPNVRMLARYLDEIELVLFESRGEDNLPSTEDIEHLVSISRDHGLTYNVHLPVDIFLGDPDPAVRDRGVWIIQKIMKLTSPLEPSTFTLHFSLRNQEGRDDTDLDGWEKRLSASMQELLKHGVASTKISVETLDYPFELVEDIVEHFDLSICLDLGHLILYGYPISDYVKQYLTRTTIVHLHGVKDGKDHISLDTLGKNEVEAICSVLQDFTGTVSLEVFSFEDLRSSLAVLEKWFGRK